jgi:predicted O-linked N-acetylglucosamine transferase (SPINDLY family)
MAPVSLSICALRAAPVQIYWLGHGGGLGLSFIEYVIADSTVIPLNESDQYTEKIARLPECYHCTDTPAISDELQSREMYGLDDGAIVFCAFNNLIKIDDEVFGVWMNILRRIPNSQLWLSKPSGSKQAEENLRAEALKRQVDPDRLVFATRVKDNRFTSLDIAWRICSWTHSLYGSHDRSGCVVGRITGPDAPR